MQHEYRVLELYGIDGSIRASIPVLDNLKDTSRAKAFERLRLLVLSAILCQIKRESKEVHHGPGARKQVSL